MKMEESELDRMLRAADIVEIQMLQGRYMSLLDRDDFPGIYELMPKDHPELSFEMVEGGEFQGEHVRNLILAEEKKLGDRKSVKRGWVGLQYMWTPNIVLSKDGTRARAQWNLLSPHAMSVSPYPGNEHKTTAYWFVGKYDNEYIKINNEWKLLKLHVCAYVRTPYDEGWLKQGDCKRIYHPGSGKPDNPSRIYTYHPDAIYSSGSLYSWRPFLPEDGSF
jgi:hypothetical protein